MNITIRLGHYFNDGWSRWVRFTVFYVGKRALGNINNLSQFVPFPMELVEREGNRIAQLKNPGLNH